LRKQFAMTANVKRYVTAVNNAVASPPGIDKFVIVTGEVGQGKTETSLWWKNHHSPHSVLVRVKKAMGPKWLLSDIASELGLMPAKTSQALFDQIVDEAPNKKAKTAVAALAGLLRASGLGMSHIHVRVNAVQINNAFRAFVHESWTRNLTERQALARTQRRHGTTAEEGGHGANRGYVPSSDSLRYRQGLRTLDRTNARSRSMRSSTVVHELDREVSYASTRGWFTSSCPSKT